MAAKSADLSASFPALCPRAAELARFDERRRRIVSRVLYDGLDGEATQLAVRLLEIEQEAVAFRHAESAERTGEFGQHADLDPVLRLCARRRAQYRQPH